MKTPLSLLIPSFISYLYLTSSHSCSFSNHSFLSNTSMHTRHWILIDPTDLVNWEDQVGLLASLADSCLRLAQSPPVNRGGEGLPNTLLHILKKKLFFINRWILGFFMYLIVALPRIVSQNSYGLSLRQSWPQYNYSGSRNLAWILTYGEKANYNLLNKAKYI